MRKFLRGLHEYVFGPTLTAVTTPLTVVGSMVVSSCPNCTQSYVRGHTDGRKQGSTDSWKAGYQYASEQADADMLAAHERAAEFQESLVEFATLVAVTA